jgi:hypothetical protein
MYKKRAEVDKEIFKSYLILDAYVDDVVADSVVKNPHAVRAMQDRHWRKLETNKLGELVFLLFLSLSTIVQYVMNILFYSRTHPIMANQVPHIYLALSALCVVHIRNKAKTNVD